MLIFRQFLAAAFWTTLHACSSWLLLHHSAKYRSYYIAVGKEIQRKSQELPQFVISVTILQAEKKTQDSWWGIDAKGVHCSPIGDTQSIFSWKSSNWTAQQETDQEFVIWINNCSSQPICPCRLAANWYEENTYWPILPSSGRILFSQLVWIHFGFIKLCLFNTFVIQICV